MVTGFMQGDWPMFRLKINSERSASLMAALKAEWGFDSPLLALEFWCGALVFWFELLFFLPFLLVTVAQESPPIGACFRGFILPELLPELLQDCVEMGGKQSSSIIMLLTVPLGGFLSALF
jgi:hypothetical protein